MTFRHTYLEALGNACIQNYSSLLPKLINYYPVANCVPVSIYAQFMEERHIYCSKDNDHKNAYRWGSQKGNRGRLYLGTVELRERGN